MVAAHPFSTPFYREPDPSAHPHQGQDLLHGVALFVQLDVAEVVDSTAELWQQPLRPHGGLDRQGDDHLGRHHGEQLVLLREE